VQTDFPNLAAVASSVVVQPDGKIVVAGGAFPSANLDVDVEYDCCVVAQYPIAEVKADGEHLNLILHRSRTQCRARERRESQVAADCCATSAACC
jgi:hypothetical protein